MTAEQKLFADIDTAGADPAEILALVRDALEAMADEMQTAEPYATRSIEAYRSAAHIVGNMAAEAEA